MGAGSVIREYRKLGAWNVLGMGAALAKSYEGENSTLLGVPAKVYRKDVK